MTTDEKLDKIIELLEALIKNPQPCERCGARGKNMQCGICVTCLAYEQEAREKFPHLAHAARLPNRSG